MHKIEVNGLVVNIDRKDIKNLHLAVYPPDGRVRVATPLRVDDEAVRLAVISKWSWVKRQQSKFEKQDRQSPREYVSGESHYFQGNRYLLKVVHADTSPTIEIVNNTTIELTVRRDSTPAQREKVFREWYREHLKAKIPALIEKWTDIMNVDLDDWGVKLMKTKWGSCNIEARRIWLNLELAKKPIRCLEYIIVHELVHLLERNHNDRFRAYMDKFLPSWRTVRDELNRSPLGYQDWEY